MADSGVDLMVRILTDANTQGLRETNTELDKLKSAQQGSAESSTAAATGAVAAGANGRSAVGAGTARWGVSWAVGFVGATYSTS